MIGAGRIGRLHAAHSAQHDQVESVVLIGRDRGRLQQALPSVKGLTGEHYQSGRNGDGRVRVEAQASLRSL